MRLQLDQIEFGFGIGSLPDKNKSYFAITGDVYYHFAGHSKLSNIRAWYARGGISYLREELTKPTKWDRYSVKELWHIIRLGRHGSGPHF